MRRCVFNNVHPVNLFLLRPKAAAAIWDLKRAYLNGAVAKRRRLFAFGTSSSLFCFPRAILWLIPIATENGRQSSVWCRCANDTLLTIRSSMFANELSSRRSFVEHTAAESWKSIKTFRNSAEISGTEFSISTVCAYFVAWIVPLECERCF